MRQRITDAVSAFVRSYEVRPGVATRWGEPLVGFCDAKGAGVRALKDAVSFNHLMPEDILPGATLVVVYFLPFSPSSSTTA